MRKTPFSYNAFISYSHSDCKDIAPAIQKGLKHIGKPWYMELSARLKVYRDQTDLAATPAFWPKIETAIKGAEHLVLLASPLTASSKWIKKEIDTWLAEYDGEDLANIYFVLCDGEIVWDDNTNDFNWEKTNSLPPALANKFVKEPLWVDVRAFIVKGEQDQKKVKYEAPGFSEGLAIIIAAIIGKRPEEVISEELNRTRKLRTIYVATGLALVVLLLIAVFLYIQQRITSNNLEIEKNHADSLRVVAETRLRNLKVEEFNRNVRNGKIYMDAEEFCLAKTVFDDAVKTINDTLYARIPEIAAQKNRVLLLSDDCNKRCK